MIRYTKTLTGVEIFSDDRAILPCDPSLVTGWLDEEVPEYRTLCVALPFKFDPLMTIEKLWESTVEQIVIVFERRLWSLRCDRLFRAAISSEFQILGPEIDRLTGSIIAPSPVDEIVIKQEDTPAGLGKEELRAKIALLAAEFLTLMSDEERAAHPAIEMAANDADLNRLLGME